MGLCWKSFKMGLGLGLAGKPLPLAKKEPIAYLYNGVRLPKLPESKLPYACITVFTEVADPNSNLAMAALFLYDKVGYLGNSANSHIHFAPYGTTLEEYLLYSTNLNVWKYGRSKWVNSEYGAIFSIDGDAVVSVWTNIDLCDYSGQVLYNKSADPIPVYE